MSQCVTKKKRDGRRSGGAGEAEGICEGSVKSTRGERGAAAAVAAAARGRASHRNRGFFLFLSLRQKRCSGSGVLRFSFFVRRDLTKKGGGKEGNGRAQTEKRERLFVGRSALSFVRGRPVGSRKKGGGSLSTEGGGSADIGL